MGFLPFAPEHLPCSVGALAVLQPCQVCIATKACSVGTLVGNALLACSLTGVKTLAGEALKSCSGLRVQLLPSGLQF